MKNLKLINVALMLILFFGMSCNNPETDEKDSKENLENGTKTTGQNNNTDNNNNLPLNNNNAPMTLQEFESNELEKLAQLEKTVNPFLDSIEEAFRKANDSQKLQEFKSLLSSIKNSQTPDELICSKLINFINNNKILLKNHMAMDDNFIDEKLFTLAFYFVQVTNVKQMNLIKNILSKLIIYSLTYNPNFYHTLMEKMKTVNAKTGDTAPVQDLVNFINKNKNYVKKCLDESEIEYFINYLNYHIETGANLKFYFEPLKVS